MFLRWQIFFFSRAVRTKANVCGFTGSASSAVSFLVFKLRWRLHIPSKVPASCHFNDSPISILIICRKTLSVVPNQLGSQDILPFPNSQAKKAFRISDKS